ncbi:MAG: hypothetical protein K5840_07370 [Eubacterium sp.]|nr:hypothetical protein [Eubacterium sp.]
MRIYSIEELCRVFIEFPSLPPTDYFNGDLCDYIENELELPDLAAGLRECLRMVSAGQSTFVSRILSYTGYATSEEIARTRQEVAHLESLSSPERRKKYADVKVEQGRLTRALRIYEDIAEGLPDSPGSMDFKASLYHNMGVVYSRMFLFANGADYFKKAYLINESQVSLDAYRKAVYMSSEDKDSLAENRLITPEDIRQIKELEDEAISRADDGLLHPMEGLTDEEILSRGEEIANEWKADYLKRSENGLVSMDFWKTKETPERR